MTELQKRLKEAKEENTLAERHAKQLGELTPEARRRVMDTIARLLEEPHAVEAA